MASIVRVADGCLKLVDNYRLSDAEKVNLIAASLLFRIGAIDAYHFDDCVPSTTTSGELLGLNSLTMTRVTAAFKRVVGALKQNGKAPDQETVLRVFHAINSHDGASITPMTKEALILNSVYKTDAQMVEAVEFIENDMNEDDEFTAFDPASKRKYYTG